MSFKCPIFIGKLSSTASWNINFNVSVNVINAAVNNIVEVVFVFVSVGRLSSQYVDGHVAPDEVRLYPHLQHSEHVTSTFHCRTMHAKRNNSGLLGSWLHGSRRRRPQEYGCSRRDRTFIAPYRLLTLSLASSTVNIIFNCLVVIFVDRRRFRTDHDVW